MRIERHDHAGLMVWIGEPVATLCYCSGCGMTWELQFKDLPGGGRRAMEWVVIRGPKAA